MSYHDPMGYDMTRFVEQLRPCPVCLDHGRVFVQAGLVGNIFDIHSCPKCGDGRLLANEYHPDGVPSCPGLPEDLSCCID